MIFLLSLLLVMNIWAEQDPFLLGVSAYNDSRFEDAKDYFEIALEKEPNQVSILTNLGMTHYKLEQLGHAAAYLRKVLANHGFDPTADKALEMTLESLPVREIPHTQLFTEQVRSLLLVPLSTDSYLGAFAVISLIWIWMILAYLGYRRRSWFAEQTPQAPSPAFFLVGIVWLLALSLTAFEIYDQQIPRATVLEQQVPAFSAPTDAAVELFMLYEGLEVKIGKIQDQWVQVTYPGGLSGWVQKSQIFHTSGRQPW